MVELLLTREDVRVNVKDEYGQTALSWAARKGYKKMAELLLTQKDVLLDSQDNRGRTPLWWAEKKGHEVVVKMLQAALNAKNGQAELSTAASE